jgi:GT2 family glycosyltransferase
VSVAAPLLSVILATPSTFDVVRRTTSHLLRQTVSSDFELVLVAASRQQLQLEEAELERLRAAFGAVRIVETGPIHSIGRANAAGIRQAAAPLVALAEDHCFPEPGWAERLIAAHQSDWAAVGPVVRNANPGSVVSWADLFIGYGPWLAPSEPREAEFLPGHNTCYKRNLLLAYGERLEALMESETVLHWELRARGHRLYVEPGARVAHLNFSLWRSWVPVQYLNGRLFAGARMRGMPALRRLLFVFGSPLIPLVRLLRVWRAAAPGEQRRRFLACSPALVIGLLLDGAGQFVGYLAGIGRAPEQVARYEFNRVDHILPADRRALLQEEPEESVWQA